MFVRALAQVHRGQVKTKHIDRANQRVQSLGNQCLAVVGPQRGSDGAQVCQKILGRGIGVLWGHGVARSVSPCQDFQRGGEARVYTCQGAAIGLVLPVFIGVR